MPKVPKSEDGKLQVDIPDLDQGNSDITCKSPTNSPRITRRTAATIAMAELDLNILFKFIKSYDGNRETLNSFLVNCDNAFELASENQKPILFKFILAQLNGKAEVACSIKEFTNWEQLKEFLKTQFSERKHYSHLLMELQESRQGSQENVNQYALRMETYLSQLLTEISLSTSKSKELPGRTAAMEDLALHHFLMGLQPRISNIVRCKTPKTLNEAINFAVSEERIQQTLYRRPQVEQKSSNNSINNNKFRNNPRPNTSSFQPSRPSMNFNPFHRVPSNSQRPFNNNNSTLFCRYCKMNGHEISTCKKREYNNARAQDHQNRNSPRVNFVEPPNEEASYDEVDEVEQHHNLNE